MTDKIHKVWDKVIDLEWKHHVILLAWKKHNHSVLDWILPIRNVDYEKTDEAYWEYNSIQKNYKFSEILQFVWRFEWYDKSPSYDPLQWDKCLCLYCCKKIFKPMMTISLLEEWDSKSYFYRVHKECHKLKTEAEIKRYDDSIIDWLL